VTTGNENKLHIACQFTVDYNKIKPYFDDIPPLQGSWLYFPAEFAPHTATWLSWPHKEESWPGK
jgi:hypothetical protein